MERRKSRKVSEPNSVESTHFTSVCEELNSEPLPSLFPDPYT